LCQPSFLNSYLELDEEEEEQGREEIEHLPNSYYEKG
jgi:hypothetical protein